MRLSEYRTLFKLFLNEEEKARSQQPTTFTPAVVGSVSFETTDGVKELPLVIDLENNIKEPHLVRTTEDEIYIIVSEDNFVTDGDSVLVAICAHEIGHYICGHIFDERSSFLTKNTRKQTYYHNRPKETGEDCYMLYMRSVFFGLLRGGVLDREIEADTIASMYVSIDQLVYLHSRDLGASNKAAVAEKINRINLLNAKAASENPNKKEIIIKICKRTSRSN